MKLSIESQKNGNLQKTEFYFDDTQTLKVNDSFCIETKNILAIPQLLREFKYLIDCCIYVHNGVVHGSELGGPIKRAKDVLLEFKTE